VLPIKFNVALKTSTVPVATIKLHRIPRRIVRILRTIILRADVCNKRQQNKSRRWLRDNCGAQPHCASQLLVDGLKASVFFAFYGLSRRLSHGVLRLNT